MSIALRRRLFDAFGVEAEYMIVDADTLDVRPIADELLRDAAGTAEYVGEVEGEDVTCSNELVAHVVELKVSEPAVTLAPVDDAFARQVAALNELLARRGARLMPGGMHPWMNPLSETTLWAHDCNEIYTAFDGVFGCRGHGWANLQSAHLNLPFADDEEFGRLHAAVRLVLPLLPALAAASPIVEGRVTGTLDSRLEVYRNNSRRIPSITGHVIPEAVFSEADYRRVIFSRMFADIAPYDSAGILQHEWLNARGAIARFERGTIEIRVLDTQECPAADLAICSLVAGLLRAMVEERFAPLAAQQAIAAERLAPIFLATVRDAEQAVINDADYLRLLGARASSSTAADLWRHLDAAVADRPDRTPATDAALGVILKRGPLARRLLAALPGSSRSITTGLSAGTVIDRAALREVYARLCDCLARGTMF